MGFFGRLASLLCLCNTQTSHDEAQNRPLSQSLPPPLPPRSDVWAYQEQDKRIAEARAATDARYQAAQHRHASKPLPPLPSATQTPAVIYPTFSKPLATASRPFQAQPRHSHPTFELRPLPTSLDSNKSIRPLPSLSSSESQAIRPKVEATREQALPLRSLPSFPSSQSQATKSKIQETREHSPVISPTSPRHSAFDLRPLPNLLYDKQSARPLPLFPSVQAQAKDQGIAGPTPALPPTSPNHRRASVVQEDRNAVFSGTEIGSELRARAREEGDVMARYFEQARAARRVKDMGASALFDQAHTHKREMERLNKEASILIIKDSERRCRPGFIDLHGLHIKEAVEYTNESVQAALERGDPQIRIIVGKGNHSKDSVAKLKPEIEKWLLRHQYVPNLDTPNGGMFVVDLQGPAIKSQPTKQPAESDPDLGHKSIIFF